MEFFAAGSGRTTCRYTSFTLRIDVPNTRSLNSLSFLFGIRSTSVIISIVIMYVLQYQTTIHTCRVPMTRSFRFHETAYMLKISRPRHL